MSMDHNEAVISLLQKCVEAFPVIILGSGASCAHGVRGMGPLCEHLLKSVVPEDSADTTTWDNFKTAVTQNGDLELSLQKSQLSSRLLDQVVCRTRDIILEDDLKVFNQLLESTLILPLSRLFQHLFRSTHQTLSVVTTNYDRIAEYAADQASAAAYTGFSEGYLKRFIAPSNSNRTTRGVRTVNIWKVHGSLDWFCDQSDVPKGIYGVNQPPQGHRPLMVTPGIYKYEQTHHEPFRTIMTQADDALSTARGFVCIGYGFNDVHIEPKLVQRVRAQQVPIAILAKSLTPKAKQFVTNCSHDRFIAIEESPRGSRVFYPGAPNGVEITASNLWGLDGLLNCILGTKSGAGNGYI